MDMEKFAKDWCSRKKKQFSEQNSILGFWDWLALLLEEPNKQLRPFSSYLRDLLFHFGYEDRDLPTGKSAASSYLTPILMGAIFQFLVRRLLKKSFYQSFLALLSKDIAIELFCCMALMVVQKVHLLTYFLVHLKLIQKQMMGSFSAILGSFQRQR